MNLLRKVIIKVSKQQLILVAEEEEVDVAIKVVVEEAAVGAKVNDTQELLRQNDRKSVV